MTVTNLSRAILICLFLGFVIGLFNTFDFGENIRENIRLGLVMGVSAEESQEDDSQSMESFTQPVGFLGPDSILLKEPYGIINFSIDDDIIYKNAYVSTNNSNWSTIGLSGNKTKGDWILNEAYGSTILNYNSAPQGNTSDNFIIVYSCTWSVNSSANSSNNSNNTNNSNASLAYFWDCHQRKWQLHQFEIQKFTANSTNQTNTTDNETNDNETGNNTCTQDPPSSCPIINGIGSQNYTCKDGDWINATVCTPVSCNEGYFVNGTLCSKIAMPHNESNETGDNGTLNSRPLIIDHKTADVKKIPKCWIERAKDLTIQYAHRSDGNNIIEGLPYVKDLDSSFNYNIKTNSLPSQTDPKGIRIMEGNPPMDEYSYSQYFWDSQDGRDATKDNWASGKFNASMWSWCSELDVYGSEVEGSNELVESYMTLMDGLEDSYPKMNFIYMTSYTQNGNSNLLKNNEKIREFAKENKKILFDFEDIGKYSPDGAYHSDADRECIWCDAWCHDNPQYCKDLPSDCSHTHPLLCAQRAQAFWWMMARLAGWDGVSTTCPN